MKKVIILLTLLLAVAPVFAEPKANIVMNAEIEDNGSSITDPGGLEEVDPIIQGPINVYLFYSTELWENASLEGDPVTNFSDKMTSITTDITEKELFDLTGDGTTGNDALYLYLYVGYNTGSNAGAAVTFSSAGWKYQETVPEGTESPVIPLEFTSDVSKKDANLKCDVTDKDASTDSVESSAVFTFEATGGTQNLKSFLAGISTVTWERSLDHLAGSYTATITIEVTPAQV